MFFNIKLLMILLALSPTVMSQKPGAQTPEVHPPLSWQKCEKAGHCTSVHGKVVIDQNWRWPHDSQGKGCITNNQWDTNICPDEVTCAKNCELEGIDYQTHGVLTNGNTLDLKLGSRLYLLANESHYELFKLLGQEFTFDVDMSKLPCGMNGAIYIVSMDQDGGAHYANNKAGAKYGTGYCDASCPRDSKFIQGKANHLSGTERQGACCAEMDFWEANSMATQITAHPCVTKPYHLCSEETCYGIACDNEGCDSNPYRMGDHSFYGPGKTVDTNKVMTVVTQFITSDGTANGELIEIKRFYVQGGHVIPNAMSSIAGVHGNSITNDFCLHQKKAFGSTDYFVKHGGLKNLGEAIHDGMVLVFASWGEPNNGMHWLDSNFPENLPASQPGIARGPCPTTSGPKSEAPTPLIFSNIRIGPINSTFSA